MVTLGDFFSEKKAPYALFGVALFAHLVVFYALMYIYGPCSFFLSNDCSVNGNDTQHYSIIAYNLSHENGYSRFVDAPFEKDALRTPLMPLYLAPFTYFGGYDLLWLAILLLNIVLPLAAPIAYKLARFFLTHSSACVVGIFMALEPLYLYRSQIAEPDALLVLLLLISIFFITRAWQRNYLHDLYRASFFLGFAILAKPSAQYISVLVLICTAVYLFWLSKFSYKESAKALAICIAIIAAVISPWLVRNTYVFGVPAISSIQGYNLYEFYTESLSLADENIPAEISTGSREPSRYLPFQNYFIQVSIRRIQTQPVAYAREQLVGTLRNLFVSDIAQIVYYHHERILPFRYNPETQANFRELLLSGDGFRTVQAFFSAGIMPKVLWVVLLSGLYLAAFMGWVVSRRNREVMLSLTLFALLYGYLVVSSGPFVDAKYRLPGLVLVVMAAFYWIEFLLQKRFLRRGQK